MSIVKTETKSVTLPKAQGKLFNAFDIEKFTKSLVYGKGLNPADTIKPSDIGMNAHAARSSLGSTVSVPGFVTGLSWSLCAIAHGQKKLSTLQEGLPPASAYALAHGASHFKHGAGITAQSLETVVLASLRAMLALPAPSKRVTDTSAPTDTPAPTEAPTDTPAPTEAPTEAANTAAESAIAAEGIPQNFVRAVTSLPRDEAEQQLRAIALALGFRLVRIKAA